jgi:polysaccharide export outer membrane protein
VSTARPPHPGGDTSSTRDTLKVAIWGQTTSRLPVESDGYIGFPLVGRVKAAGLTPTAFAADLRAALEKDYLVNPQVLVSVKEFQSQKVHVNGEAEKPGVYFLSGPTTVRDISLRRQNGQNTQKYQVLQTG